MLAASRRVGGGEEIIIEIIHVNNILFIFCPIYSGRISLDTLGRVRVDWGK